MKLTRQELILDIFAIYSIIPSRYLIPCYAYWHEVHTFYRGHLQFTTQYF